ncbi:MAG: hypothetical protein ACYSRR_04995, partial [Planctomycetota bacterium]
MAQLNNEQKQLLFDYSLGLASQEEILRAESIISSSREAADLYASFKAGLSILEAIEIEHCPDELAERTIAGLCNAANSSQQHLTELLAAEQTKTISPRSRLWRNLGQITAAAAIIIIVSGVMMGPLKVMRSKSIQQRCQMQLGNIFRGFDNYVSEHGKMPAVVHAKGEPWWKVGYQGRENHSNTRPVWLLVKNGYVNADDFTCPGKRPSYVVGLSNAQLKNYNDFPSRKYINFSFRIMCRTPQGARLRSGRVLVADMNPLFEQLPNDFSKPLILQINKNLLTINSSNHKGRGQNVLFGDGSCRFVKKRNVEISADDIFTLQNTQVYKGVE